jgi:hypothetical protein
MSVGSAGAGKQNAQLCATRSATQGGAIPRHNGGSALLAHVRACGWLLQIARFCTATPLLARLTGSRLTKTQVAAELAVS